MTGKCTRLFLGVFLGVLLLSCMSCKTAFNESIKCASYEASGVSVYKLDPNTWVVLHPDKTHELVDASTCVVER